MGFGKQVVGTAMLAPELRRNKRRDRPFSGLVRGGTPTAYKCMQADEHALRAVLETIPSIGISGRPVLLRGAAHGSIGRRNRRSAPGGARRRRRRNDMHAKAEGVDAASVYLSRYLSRPWTRFYEPGTPATAEVPLKSVPQAFDEATDKYADKTALFFHGRAIRYRELREAADRLAGAFARLGLKKGDRVALYLLNSPQFIIAYFAALKCGCVVTPISPVYTSHEVRFQLENSGARAVVCQDILLDNIRKSGAALEHVVVTRVSEYLPMLKRLFDRISSRPGSPELPRGGKVHRFQELIAQAGGPPEVTIDQGTDLAALPYTGGTTGSPKGVMLTHRNLIAASVISRSIFRFEQEGEEVIMAFLPFFHIFGQVVIMLNGLLRGHSLVLFTTPDTEGILEAVEKYRVTIFHGVPTFYEYLKDHKDTGKVDWKRLKLILSGADTLH